MASSDSSIVSQLAFCAGLCAVTFQVLDLLLGERFRGALLSFFSKVESVLYDIRDARWIKYVANEKSLTVVAIPAVLIYLVFFLGPLAVVIYFKAWPLVWLALAHTVVTAKGAGLLQDLISFFGLDDALDRFASPDSTTEFVVKYIGLLFVTGIYTGVYVGGALAILYVVDLETSSIKHIATLLFSLLFPGLLILVLAVVSFAPLVACAIAASVVHRLAMILRFLLERICLYSGGVVQAALTPVTAIAFLLSYFSR